MKAEYARNFMRQHLLAGYVVLAGYVKYHYRIRTEELFGIRKKVVVNVRKEQMVSTCTKTSSSEPL